MAESLEQRNARVDADKAWEISWTRRLIIAFVTYGVIGVYLNMLEVADAWFHALVPAVAYILSTLGLRYIKLIWVKIFYKPRGVLQ